MNKENNAVKLYAALAVLGWSFLILVSLFWNIHQARHNALELARTEAVENIRKDLSFRQWASSHGGVYVPADETTRPNPYLYVPNREIPGPDGTLTLMNPAYMLRHMQSMFDGNTRISGHITSLNPINPDNAPDEWERKALTAIQGGAGEMTEIIGSDGKQTIRVMQPMLTEPSCLKCHAQQGYKVGDIRGGISATVSLEPFLVPLGDRNNAIVISHAGAWLLGLLFIALACLKSLGWIAERHAAESHQRLVANVFRFAHEGIIITDTQGVCLDVNSTFCAITGYDRNEIVGENPRILGTGQQGPGFFRDVFGTIDAQGFWTGEIWNRRKNGEIYPSQFTISAVRAQDGHCTHYVGTFADISQIRQQQSSLEQMAHYDPLTKLPNRLLMLDRLSLAIETARRNDSKLLIGFLDLDEFKAINDSRGQSTGDQLLVDLAERLKGLVRGSDTVSRIGGDEFVLIIGDLASKEEGERFLARLMTAISTPMNTDGGSINISASIGATLFPSDPSDPETLVRHADHAMYVAKQAGRNRYQLFDPDNDRQAKESLDAVNRIRSALRDEEFCLFYQPKVDMRSGIVFGVEALIRWNHPERGILPPSEFLPRIEGTDLDREIGEWVIDRAMRQLTIWEENGLQLSVSINISANHLQSGNFFMDLKSILAAYSPHLYDSLEIEILETTALENVSNVATIIMQCHSLGVSFAIDDFGTGYSSLSYLKRLPANTLKIDQDFVRTMLVNEEDRAIVKGVIGLAQAFQRNVIAEGVESSEHGVALMKLGCYQVQGYGIARPMPADAVPAWAQSWSPSENWLPVKAYDESA